MLSGESYYPRHAEIPVTLTIPADYRPAFRLREPIANAMIGLAAAVEAFDPSDYERPVPAPVPTCFRCGAALRFGPSATASAYVCPRGCIR